MDPARPDGGRHRRQGIGQGVCLRLAREGARVGILDRERADDTAAQLEALGVKAAYAPADIAEAVACFATAASWITGQVVYVDGGFMATGLPVLEGLGPPPS